MSPLFSFYGFIVAVICVESAFEARFSIFAVISTVKLLSIVYVFRSALTVMLVLFGGLEKTTGLVIGVPPAISMTVSLDVASSSS